MGMSKKDFIALADALRPLAVRQPYQNAPALSPDVAAALVAFCKTQNAKFDAARFLALLAGEKPKPVIWAAAERMAHKIQAFREDCEADEHTDTGDAWAILDEAERVLRRMEGR